MNDVDHILNMEKELAMRAKSPEDRALEALAEEMALSSRAQRRAFKSNVKRMIRKQLRAQARRV